MSTKCRLFIGITLEITSWPSWSSLDSLESWMLRHSTSRYINHHFYISHDETVRPSFAEGRCTLARFRQRSSHFPGDFPLLCHLQWNLRLKISVSQRKIQSTSVSWSHITVYPNKNPSPSHLHWIQKWIESKRLKPRPTTAFKA